MADFTKSKTFFSKNLVNLSRRHICGALAMLIEHALHDVHMHARLNACRQIEILGHRMLLGGAFAYEIEEESCF